MNITEKLKEFDEQEDNIEEGLIEPSDYYNNNYINNDSIDYDDEKIDKNMNDDNYEDNIEDSINNEDDIDETIENENSIDNYDNNNSFVSIDDNYDDNYDTNIENSIDNQENNIDETSEVENNIENDDEQNDNNNSFISIDNQEYDIDENSKEELNNIKEIIEILKFEKINENKINNNLETNIKENISNPTNLNIKESFINLENKIIFLENSIKELINIVKNISMQNISQMKEETFNNITTTNNYEENIKNINNNQKDISNATIKNNNLNIDNYAIISKRTTKIYINNKLVDEILNIIEELPIVPTKDHILDMKLIENDFKYFVVGEELSEKMYGISSKSNIQIDNKLFFTIMYKYINTFYQNVNLIKKDI